MVSPIHNSMHSFVGNLICYISAAVTKNATGHVQLYVRTNIFFFKSAAGKLVAGAFFAMIVAEILQVALTGLVANRTI